MAQHHNSQVEEALRQQGQRLTPQRRLILDVMRNSRGHLTADDVVELAAQRQEDVSIASVYRILGWLVEHRLVSVTDVGGRDVAYEYLGSHRHHHLICQHCGSQQEVPFDLMDPLISDVRRRFGFEPRIDHQAIFGMCQTCQSAAAAEEGTTRD